MIGTSITKELKSNLKEVLAELQAENETMTTILID